MRKFFITVILSVISVVAFATQQGGDKVFNLLASPSDKSTIVATLPVGAPIIPVIRQKDWVKVADPKTGAVGWVQATKIEQSPIVITQIIAGNSNYCKDNNCHFSFYSNARPLSAKENDELWRKLQAQERYLMAQQLAMQKRMNEFMDDMNELMTRNLSDMNHVEQVQPREEQHSTQPNVKNQGRASFWKFWEK